VHMNVDVSTKHRNCIHRLLLPANAAVKICTIVILGLPTPESVWLRWGKLLVNLYLNPKLIFMTLSPSIYPIDVKVVWMKSKDMMYLDCVFAKNDEQFLS